MLDKSRKKQLNTKFWLAKNKEEQHFLIKQSSYVFLGVGALHILLGFIIGVGTIIDGFLMAGLGAFLYFFQSRIAAVILVLLGTYGVYATFINKITEEGVGGRNVFLSIIMLYAAIIAVWASFKYNDNSSSAPSSPQENKPNAK